MAGTELEHLIGSLERLRATFAWKAGGLDAAGLSHRLETSSLSLGRLLKHLSRAEDEMFTRKLWGEPVSEPWRSAPWHDDPDWDFSSADDDPPEDLYRNGLNRALFLPFIALIEKRMRVMTLNARTDYRMEKLRCV